jgi:hypothetical protein
MSRGNDLGMYRNREISSSIRGCSGLTTKMGTNFYKNCESFVEQLKRPESSNNRSLGIIINQGRRLKSGNSPRSDKRVEN